MALLHHSTGKYHSGKLHCRPIYWNIFYLIEISILLTEKWVILAVIGFEIYGPNVVNWSERISVSHCSANTFHAALNVE